MSSTPNRFRVLLALALFGAVIFAPWWAPLTLALVLAARFRAWEIVIAGVLYDLLWLPEISLSSPWTLPLGTLISLIFIIGLEPLRRRLLVGPAVL